jgi:hypothetical protein
MLQFFSEHEQMISTGPVHLHANSGIILEEVYSLLDIAILELSIPRPIPKLFQNWYSR